MGNKQAQAALYELIRIEQQRIDEENSLIGRLYLMIGKLEHPELLTQDDLITITYLCNASIRDTQKTICNAIRACGISRLNTYDFNPYPPHCKIGIEHAAEILTYPIKDTALQNFVWSSYTKPLNTFYESTNIISDEDEKHHLKLLLEPDNETSIYYNSEPLK